MKKTKVVRCLIPLIGALVTVVPVGAAVFTVGPVGSPGCTHSSLADAISSAASNPGSDQIRLLDGSTHTGFLLLAGPLSITGGFQTCTATGPIGTSTLRAPSGSRVISAIANGEAIILSNLLITGGSVSGDGGGIRLSGVAGLLLLQYTSVAGNSAAGRGGGIYIEGSGGLIVRLYNSGVLLNQATDGGGIACEASSPSAGTIAVLSGNSLIESNAATHDGGGLWINGAGCRVESSVLDGFSHTVASNAAANLGGGVFVQKGRFDALGSGSAMIRVEGNTAASGAGIYTFDQGLVVGEHLDIVNNDATNFGGGIMVGLGGLAFLTSVGQGPSTCTPPGRCLRLRGNSATTGAAISVGGGIALVEMAEIFSNQASGSGSAVGEVRTGGRLTVLNTLVRNNFGNDLLAVDNTNSELELSLSTVVNNAVTGGLVGVGVNAASVRFDGNLVANHTGPLFSRYDRPTPPTLRCTMSTSAALFAGLPVGTVQEISLVQPNPGFRAPALNDFHLVRNAAASDACPPGSISTSSTYDFDGEDRDFDNPWNGTGGAVRDIGADEFGPFFADDFETGDSSRWSSTVPLQ